jgi:hypothetical protein
MKLVIRVKTLAFRDIFRVSKAILTKEERTLSGTAAVTPTDSTG